MAVYSTTDATALHAQLADEAICIGPAGLKDSYLNPFAILSAAEVTGADAIHPGYGFLSENPKFVRMCDKCGITFIGPDADSMQLMGNKLEARKLMIQAGVPVIPGSPGALTDAKEAAACAKKIGYPVMIKAAAGGGGRGIRKVNSKEEIGNAFAAAKSESEAAFGDGTLYMEKCIENARHIEIQVLADEFGSAVYLFERECSLQRRNQKMMEEAPSPFVDETMREAMGQAAVRAVQEATSTKTRAPSSFWWIKRRTIILWSSMHAYRWSTR